MHSPTEGHRSFLKTYHLHLRGRKVRKEKTSKKQETSTLLHQEDEDSTFLRNVGGLETGLQGVTPQKAVTTLPQSTL
jgi:hypothetical protein